MYKELIKDKKGFTLLELLLVVAIIAILAGIVILALTPTKQISGANDIQRTIDVNTIMNSVQQYAINNNGSFPSEITNTSTEICTTGAVSCAGLINLSVLTDGKTFLTTMPEDPSGEIDTNGTGYEIFVDINGEVTVAAPQAETASISVTK